MSTRHSLAAGLTATAAGAALVLVPSTSTAAEEPAPRTSQHSDDRAPVLGTAADQRYVVVLEKGVSRTSARSVRSQAEARGARVTHTYRAALDGFAAKLPDRALRGLRNNPRVAYIEADGVVQASDVESPATWGIDRVDQRALPLSNSYTFTDSGAGVKAYVIDTGIRRTHSEFSGRATSGYTAINDGRGTDDCNGHGTHVAGTVGGETYGVAQDVSLVAVRVLDCQGSGTNSGVIAGVDWVTSNHSAGSPAVANMSLGGGASSALDTAVNNSIADGVTYVVAAGNENADACGGSPSRVPNALTTGSSTSSDSRSSFSNWGSCLDLFAPGSSITSAWHDSDSATKSISGTSMAAPHVAGAAALHLQANPSASPSAVSDAITSNATSGVVTDPKGSPNRLLYTGDEDGGGDPTPEPGVCTDHEAVETGSLTGTGDENYHPSATDGYYYSSVSGTHVGCLDGPDGVDFDLYLDKWNGSSWVQVASSISIDADEEISYSGTSGYYSWRVDSYSGSGSYTIGMDRP